MNEIAQQFISTVLPHLDLRHEHCTVHHDAPGRVICPDCQRLFCKNCIEWDHREEKLACQSCLKRRNQRRRRRYLFHWAFNPLFYVLLLGLIGAVYFRVHGGAGTKLHSPAASGDSRWFKRTAGVEHLLQARRAISRAQYLERKGHLEAAQPWYKLTASGLSLAGECFGKFPGTLDIAIGIQHARGKSGDVAPALVELLKLDSQVDEDDARRLPYLFARAELHWLAEDRESACEDWGTILKLTAGQRGMNLDSMLDSTVEMMSGGLHEAAVNKRLKEAADTSPAPELWRGRTLDALNTHGIDHEVFLREASPKTDLKLERF